jgi:hypothetical protein
MIPISKQIACVKRELKLREATYPKWVKSGKLKEEKAAEEIETMRAVLVNLIQQDNPEVTSASEVESPPTLYKQFLEAYDEFCKSSIGVGAKMDGAQGKALKSIIEYLKSQANTKDEAGALVAWKFILKHWDRVGDFIGKQKSLTQINKNLVEILDKIRNGHNKKAADKNQLSSLKSSIINGRSFSADSGHAGT